MTDTKNKIESFIENTISKQDNLMLDILWIFSYSIPSMSGYHNNQVAFKKWLGKVCVRNLQKKYGLKLPQIKEKMKIFIDFLNSMPNFLSKETFNEDDKLLREILFSKTSKILTQNINNKLDELPELEKEILSFILNYIPIRITDSIKEAEKRKQEYPSYEDKYGFLLDFHIRANKETGEIVYYDIDPKEWTYIFNVLFDEELTGQQFKAKSHKRISGLILFPQEQHEEYTFWQFGDELVKIGIGYWTFYLSAKGNINIEFIIPNFIYESVKGFKDKLPKPENFEKRIEEIKKEKETKKSEKAWSLEDLEETEAISEVLESEIESSIISNPEILEDGLELIGNQYTTGVGYIDILCKDKNGNFVVIELKRGKGSHKVVGQIQKYIAWINENLAQDKQVRGIIVVKEHDKELEYAIKGSKYTIEIKVFGREPPLEGNLKYCTNCGKQLPKSAKFCDKCGQNVWL